MSKKKWKKYDWLTANKCNINLHYNAQIWSSRPTISICFWTIIPRILQLTHNQSLRVIDEETTKAEGISSAVQNPRLPCVWRCPCLVRRFSPSKGMVAHYARNKLGNGQHQETFCYFLYFCLLYRHNLVGFLFLISYLLLYRRLQPPIPDILTCTHNRVRWVFHVGSLAAAAGQHGSKAVTVETAARRQ